ncbi:hypothetical protein EEL51_09415 [Muribaculaceae bacterium Isolate-110 (HZI)]|nr:hypothetical protein EEL51_09415 [Muribaculaceae bacterium Isolate-110 (HZI)]
MINFAVKFYDTTTRRGGAGMKKDVFSFFSFFRSFRTSHILNSHQEEAIGIASTEEHDKL